MTALPTFTSLGSGPIILMLHGIGGGHRAFAPQVETFASLGYRAVAWDMPGYGRSAPIEPYTFKGLAQACINLIEGLQCGGVTLLGHSMGGMVAQEVVARRPELVSRLILCGTSPSFGKPDGDWQREFIAQRTAPLDAGKTMAELAEVRAPEVVHRQYSQDGTRKWVFRVGDGAGSLIETVLIPASDKTGDRKTLCISSQVGCALDCSFCSTGKQGFQRDLTPAEIIGQLWVANQSYMEDVPVSERSRTVTNVVMMGMGEPLLNYDAVVAAMRLMMDDFAYGLSRRRVTLSTSGVVPMLDRLGDELDVALAISLHAPNDALRDELVPINKKYPLNQLDRKSTRLNSSH